MEINTQQCVARLTMGSGHGTWVPFGWIHKFVVAGEKEMNDADKSDDKD